MTEKTNKEKDLEVRTKTDRKKEEDKNNDDIHIWNERAEPWNYISNSYKWYKYEFIEWVHMWVHIDMNSNMTLYTWIHIHMN